MGVSTIVHRAKALAERLNKEEDQSYDAYHLEQAIPLIRFSCVLGAVTAVFFYWVDDFFLTVSADMLKAFRIYYMLPVTLIWLAVTLFDRTRPYIFWIIVTTGLPFGLIFVYTLYVEGPSATLYVGIALMQVCLFVVLLFGMPLRFIIPPITIFIGSLAAVMIILDVPLGDRLIALTSVLTVSFLGSAVAFQTGRRQRTSFHQRQEIRRLRVESERKQLDRLNWFQGFSGFLRHELQNALTGVGTSLQMIQRHSESESIDRYSDRATRSTEFMSRMLDRTAEATNLEAALHDEVYEPTELLELARIKVDEFAEFYPENQFEFLSAAKLPLVGNGDRFEQVLDKLLINAVEHSDGRAPIRVAVSEEGRSVIFSVENSGDKLPANSEDVFDVFYSTKSGATANLGIGLFVARTIIQHMGGTLTAHSGTSENVVVFRIALRR